ncbi:hypothetical protein ACFQ0B_61280 [Nonomuraea thailandensis]
MAHLDPEQLGAALSALAPGRLIDLRGTTVTSDLLSRVLDAAGRRPGGCGWTGPGSPATSGCRG